MAKKTFLYCFIFLMLAAQTFQASAQRRFIRGLQGKDSLSITKVWLGSMIIPGYGQAYNKQYWKIPVIYGGMGGFIAAGLHFNSKVSEAKKWMNYAANSHMPQSIIDQYKKEYKYDSYKTKRDLCYMGAGLVYIAGALDAVASYKSNRRIIPQRAALYSALCPGLGQAYNGDYWKIPIIYGGLGFCAYWASHCNAQYHRYRKAYIIKYNNENNIPGTTAGEVDEFGGRYSSTTLKSARDRQRRNRDLTYLVTGLVYVLNIVDANVFANLRDFDVSPDLSMRVEPTIINEQSFALGKITPSVGMRLQLNFNKPDKK